MKKTFLNNEIWILTFGGAFQRAQVYSENYPEKTRIAFRKALRDEVEKLVNNKYQVKVSENEHITNIKSIVSFSNDLKVENTNIPINFGVAQKMLNLYLKYLWCLGELKYEPTHFPVDRLIQIELNKITRNEKNKHLKIAPKKIEAWTQFKDESKYIDIINLAKTIIDKVEVYKHFSLAQLELTLFDRR
ncbi:hypothetical protein [Olleya sp. Bg11-27]|uniref:hypothetical protein n=1 Tax=Olleya sp. Bg11-27 TaxID=2058135 RepID=UPI000C314986|nr:hypothetical protein [Olleya sp. Bg11-27]AUC76138.1 hypothetical protein CW732_10870 [Olleya sp. Bg11-27]